MRLLLGSATRIAVLGAAVAAAAASSSSNQQKRPSAPPSSAGPTGAPPPADMDSDMALGLWHSSFGPVKIEPQQAQGQVMGVWVYDRQGEQVVGYFQGGLDGNVLDFSWEEPADPKPLRGRGFLVFDPAGRSFHGKWWTKNRDRGGDWNGWRDSPHIGRDGAAGGKTYGGKTYGGGNGSGTPEDGTPPPTAPSPR